MIAIPNACWACFTVDARSEMNTPTPAMNNDARIVSRMVTMNCRAANRIGALS
jgi:hypothetical protein